MTQSLDNLADLVSRFSVALLEKLRAAEVKYGHSDVWMRDDWRDSLCRHLTEHVAKGDPRDVAAYAAFAWHHGWSVAGAAPAGGLPGVEAACSFVQHHASDGSWQCQSIETGRVVETRRDGPFVGIPVYRCARSAEPRPAAAGGDPTPAVFNRWIDQTRLHDEDNGVYGDCTRAAVASYFALPLNAVPDFNTLNSLEYWREISAFFYRQGYNLRRFDKGTAFEWPTYVLVAGISPRGYPHMVVMYDNEIVHDPHPSRAGLVKVGGMFKVDYALVAIPLDPAARLADRQARPAAPEGVDGRQVTAAMVDAATMAFDLPDLDLAPDETGIVDLTPAIRAAMPAALRAALDAGDGGAAAGTNKTGGPNG